MRHDPKPNLKHHVIITAKKGKGKHLLQVLGKPLISYPMEAAIASTTATTRTLWSDCPQMLSEARERQIRALPRPTYTCTADSPHIDIILHAIRAQEIDPYDIVTVLLGNTVHIDGELIDQCFDIVASDGQGTDSVLTAWKAQDDHPFRALSLHNGYVYSYGQKPADTTTNRQSYPDVYYYDQGCWTFRAYCAFEKAGPSPWIWLGTKCRLVERPWVTGRDVHGDIDLLASEMYLLNHDRI